MEKRVKLLPLRDVLPKCNLVAIAKAALIHLEVARNAGPAAILGERKTQEAWA